MIVQDILKARGEEYGDYRAGARRAQAIYTAIVEPEAASLSPEVRHTFYMLAVKLARLRANPSHKDSWEDMAGYALLMVSEESEE